MELPQRRRTRKLWSEEEDEKLLQTVETYGSKWVQVAQIMSNNRNASQCSQRWKKLSSSKAQTRWTLEEDQIVLNYQLKDPRLGKLLPNRTMKQIRERFINVLNPQINREKFSKEEDEQIWRYTQEFGHKWTKLSQLLPGRPENMIKNRFYSYIQEEYGNAPKPYFVAYKRGKKSAYQKKVQKTKLKKEAQVQQCVEENAEASDLYPTLTYLSCGEEAYFEESQQFSFQGLL